METVANTREVMSMVPLHDGCQGPLVVFPAYKEGGHWRVECGHLRVFDVPRGWLSPARAMP